MRIIWVGCLILFCTSIVFAQGDDDPLNTQALIKSHPIVWEQCRKVDVTKALGLEDVVMGALCNNPQTKIAWQTTLYQASLVGVSQSSYLPALNATGSISKITNSITQSGDQESVGLTLSYLLYDFGKRDANYEASKYLLNAALYSENSTIQAVFLSSLQSYYTLFGAQASLDASRKAERAALESLNAAKERYRIGVTTPADTLQAQTAYSQAMLNRIRAEGSVRSVEGQMASVLGLSPETRIILNAPLLQPPSEEGERAIRTLMTEAQKNRPDLLAASANIKASEATIKAAQADGMPSFSLTSNVGETNTVNNTNQRTSSIGLYVSIPLFTGYATKYKIQAAQQQLKINEAQYDKLSSDANLEVYQQYQSLISETQAVRTSFDLVRSAQASYDLNFGRYKAGVGTILDLLNAQSSLASAQQQNIQALYNWYISKATLAKAMGKLDFTAIKGQH
ncbi:MAG: TolC family protein [Sulfurospirillaceae bacterium]|nr:TolC family protein [Sulfurospirillaceae bacterium]